METLSILNSKSNNYHYLLKYYNFINKCIEINSTKTPEELVYVENHHILPKSKDMFPEYKSFKKYPWNKATLTYRQHIIAHILLWKAYNTVSQTLSILRTINQKHTKHLSLKSINSKLISRIKQDLSDKRKGVYTRGYKEDGTPNVLPETKQKLSKLKTDFYSIEENRIKQSIACSGRKKSNTTKMSSYSKNRPETHNKNLAKSIQKYYDDTRKEGKSLKRIKDGIYITPFGIFTCIYDFSHYCKNPDKPFNSHHTKKNPKLNKNIIGKTPRELGFFFIEKSNPLIEQYYDNLNQVHPPEPNHPLWSELNDYLSQQKLLP